MKQILFIMGLAFLSGCTTTKKIPTVPIDPVSLFNHTLFNSQPTPQVKDIFNLPVTEQNKFFAYHQNALKQGVRQDRVISAYLESKLNSFSYDGATLSATQTLNQDQGNCISLAILTQAYANLIGIETSFREVASIPVYKMSGQTLLISNHFNTKLLAPTEKEEGWISAIRPGTVIDYFPAQDIYFVDTATVNDLTAKFYANHAADALLNKRFNESYSYIIQAFKNIKDDPELINIAAILHRRAGDSETAKQLFEFALTHNLVSTNLLTSYAALAQENSNYTLVTKLENMTNQIAKTPFDIISIAQKAIHKKQYTKAEKLLSELSNEYSYLPEPYFELAKLYYLKNELVQSKAYLSKALSKAEDQKKLGIYQAKLSTLEQITHKK
ncbi:hypothetical protein BGP78_20700 [Pseudoalteromonas sp. MSK9-3]|uniref:tetratricopeptide repeat protein n=1 Tax=Pseudoalteromonas sp. MSK9-3 TaxID=1897633 RepID=UPI000E6BECA5|nr:hypothetical protein [Pseudoalteromonas sp. MSK9-3]RJE71244.1 hypothetical protein BGP78_20700 [Pseudoalteromonas sp. MSK9-3]